MSNASIEPVVRLVETFIDTTKETGRSAFVAGDREPRPLPGARWHVDSAFNSKAEERQSTGLRRALAEARAGQIVVVAPPEMTYSIGWHVGSMVTPPGQPVKPADLQMATGYLTLDDALKATCEMMAEGGRNGIMIMGPTGESYETPIVRRHCTGEIPIGDRP